MKLIQNIILSMVCLLTIQFSVCMEPNQNPDDFILLYTRDAKDYFKRYKKYLGEIISHYTEKQLFVEKRFEPIRGLPKIFYDIHASDLDKLLNDENVMQQAKEMFNNPSYQNFYKFAENYKNEEEKSEQSKKNIVLSWTMVKQVRATLLQELLLKIDQPFVLTQDTFHSLSEVGKNAAPFVVDLIDQNNKLDSKKCLVYFRADSLLNCLEVIKEKQQLTSKRSRAKPE